MNEVMIELFTAENGIALVTLTALEIVLGIDNIVFLAIITGKLEPQYRARARQIGLSLAMGMRLGLLLAITWVMGLTKPLFTLAAFNFEHAVSGRDLILVGGGLFLIAKATYEIHEKLEGHHHEDLAKRRVPSFWVAIVQIVIIDMVFSLDSVITAVGMAEEIAVMMVAVVIAVGVMLMFAGSISHFVERHPTVKMLALSFLLLIGMMLVVEGVHGHIPKGYIYSAMAFSLFVELLNIRHNKVRDDERRAAGR
jgi:predicted tellurium resistance membrane protein TerC